MDSLEEFENQLALCQINELAHQKFDTFLKTSIFEALYFLKMSPIFVGSEVVRSSSYQKNIFPEFTHLYIS